VESRWDSLSQPGMRRHLSKRTCQGKIDAATVKQPALQALAQVLQLRPDAITWWMEFLEAWLSDEISDKDVSI
jgi:hypothetical protein